MVTNFKAIGTTTIKFVSIRKQHPSNWTVPCLCGQFAVSLRCFWFLSTATQSSQFFRRLLKRKGSCQNYKVASGTKHGFPTMESTSKLAAMTPLNFNAKFLANVPELPYVLARWFRCVFSSLFNAIGGFRYNPHFCSPRIFIKPLLRQINQTNSMQKKHCT